jgi:hypothetical protein
MLALANQNNPTCTNARRSSVYAFGKVLQQAALAEQNILEEGY